MTLLASLLSIALALTPTPQECKRDAGKVFRIGPSVPVIVADDVAEKDLAGLDALFEMVGHRLTVLPAAQFKPGPPAIYWGTLGRHGSFENRKVRKWAEYAEGLDAQGYAVAIWPKGVVLAGAGAAGTQYALTTLLQLVKADPLAWPCLRLRDWPSRKVRGALLSGIPGRDEIVRFAGVKCNYLFFDSPGLGELDAVRTKAWRNVFADARVYGIEPVPVIRPYNATVGWLARFPEAAEGRTVTDELTLAGDDWAALSKRNVIHTEESPVRVSISGLRCRSREDFALESGGIAVPYDAAGRPWLIRRVPGGRIPDGATVSVRYSYAPEGTRAVCPRAAETEALWKAMFGGLMDALAPAYVCLGGGAAGRVNDDLRCLEHGQSPGEVRREATGRIAGLLKEMSPDVRLVEWHDESPGGGGERGALLTLVGGKGKRSTIAAVVDGDAADAYVAARERPGVVIATGAPSDLPFRWAMEKAWSVETPVLAWPEGLNAYFGAGLWQPDYEEGLAAVVTYLNGCTVSGQKPEASFEAFSRVAGRLERVLPEDDPELTGVERLYRNLCRYLELEARFNEDANASTLVRLVDLVENQAQLDPDFADERRQRIVETIEGQGLFVPSRILFDAQVLHYRSYALPQGHPVYEVPVAPVFSDGAGETEALLDLLAPGPLVARIDYETFAAGSVALSSSNDGEHFEHVETWVPADGRGVRGPAVLLKPTAPRALRLTVKSGGESAVLRELRVFGLKPPARLNCEATAERPALDTAWPAGKAASAFVLRDAPRFAEAPTVVRLCRSRSHFFVRARAYEPRVHAMVSDGGEEGAPLWEQESFEVRIRRADGRVYRFVVNPRGASYESLDGDGGWEAVWEAQAAIGADRWRALVALPFEAVGGPPRRVETWQVNFSRHRHNIVREHSVWAPGGGDGQDYPYGEVVFR